MRDLPLTARRILRFAIAAAMLAPMAAHALVGTSDGAAVAVGGDCRGGVVLDFVAASADGRDMGQGRALSALERIRAVQQGDMPAVNAAPASGGSPIAADLSINGRFPVEPAAACSEPPARPALDGRDGRAPFGADDEFELGSLAIPIETTRFDDRWDRVRRAPPAALMRAELQRAGVTRGLDEADIIRRVNQWVNHRIAYVDDDRNYGERDFWATAEQTIARGRGDCEDFAILKMQMLVAAGIDADSVKLVLLRDLAANADHALLLVRSQAGRLALDNVTDRLYDGSQSNDMRPILSFSGARRWVHGYRDARPVLAVATVPAIQGLPVRTAADGPVETSPPSLAPGADRQAGPGFRSIRLSSVLYRPDPASRSWLLGAM